MRIASKLVHPRTKTGNATSQLGSGAFRNEAMQGGRTSVLPIRTEKSSLVYRSSDPAIPDTPGERVEPGHIRSVWELTQWEPDDIFHGGNIELNISASRFPRFR